MDARGDPNLEEQQKAICDHLSNVVFDCLATDLDDANVTYRGMEKKKDGRYAKLKANTIEAALKKLRRETGRDRMMPDQKKLERFRADFDGRFASA